MSSILVRRLDQNWDPMRGQGLNNFAEDLEAVTIIIGSTIKLLAYEWFESLAQGTPLFQSILGVPNTAAGIASILQQRIQSVPFVNSAQNVQVLNLGNRALSFSATVNTAFGSVQISTQESIGAQAAINS